MAKRRIGAEAKPPRMSYLARSPSDPPEAMSVDESETLLGGKYNDGGGTKKFDSPAVTILEMDGLKRSKLTQPATGSPAISSSNFIEGSNLNSGGKFSPPLFFNNDKNSFFHYYPLFIVSSKKKFLMC